MQQLRRALYIFMLVFAGVSLSSMGVWGQFRKIDSLRMVLYTAKDKKQVDVLNELASQYWRVAPDSAKEFAQRAYKQATDLNYDKGRAQALNNEGAVYFVKGIYVRSLELHFQALAIAEALNDDPEAALSLRRIGNVYLDQNNNEKGREFYSKALKYLSKINDYDALASTLNNIGVSYVPEKNFTAALDYLNQGLRAAIQSRLPQTLAIVYTSLGETYLAQGSPDKALSYLKKALEESLQDGELDTRAYIQIHIGKCYLHLHKYEEAAQYAKEGLKLSRSLESRNTMSIGYSVLADIYIAKHDSSTAFIYEKAYADLRDTIMNQESIRRIQQLQSTYEIEAKNREILLLQSEQELSSLWRNSLIAGLIGMIVVVILVVNRIRIEHKAELTLQIKNDELAATATQLEAVNNEKNEFIGIVAHDLKNPLSNIKGIASVLEDPTTSTEEVREFASIIRETSEKMFELIQNLLDVNRIERGGITFTLAPFVPNLMVAKVVEDYARRAHQKAITIRYENTLPEEYYAVADDKSYFQVIENIISNAVKYSPYGKNIYVRLLLHKNNVRLEVQDEGPGLTPEDLSKLFGKFARLSAQPTGGEHSTGLGLSIVKKLVEAMNGTIWCESEYGKGAMFIVEFPSQRIG